ncbi:MAG: hypothetical protein IJA61_01685 [Clostridia bacterium]|nr:hypothetical protein [Clostridia bacterium]
MKKKRAIKNFIILGILLAICFVFSFVSFRIPTTVDNFAGFVNGIYKGIDFNGGLTATYTIEYNDNFKGDMEAAVEKASDRVKSLLSTEFTEYKVEKIGEDKIRITIPKLTETTTISTNYLVNYITFTTTEVTDAENFEPTLTGAQIKDAAFYTANGAFGALIEFTDEGKEALRDMAESIQSSTSASTLYIYQNKDYSATLLRVSVDYASLDQIANSGQLFISDKTILPTRDAAEAFADKIASGMLNVDMSTEDSVMAIEPMYGECAVVFAMFMVVALILGGILYFIVKYRHLAIAPIMSFLSFVAMSVILLPIFSKVQMSIAGMYGLVIAIAVTLFGHVVYLEKSREEFASGNKLLASFKRAYPRSVIFNVDLHAVLFIVSILTTLVSFGALKTISAVVALLLVPSALSTMLIHRGMVKWYLDYNPTKYKKFKFEKGVTEDEKE